jgi:hypothetical protein
MERSAVGPFGTKTERSAVGKNWAISCRIAPWQRALLRSTSDKVLLLCHRQAGKSTATAALAVHTALSEPGSLILLVSASLRQTGELFDKVVWCYDRLGKPVSVVEDNATTLRLATGSRVVSLPDSPDTIVGFSGPRLIVIDEGSRTSDETFRAVRPMLASSRGRLVAMTTPRGQRGWFCEQWHAAEIAWERVRFPVTDNPRIDPAWLEEERLILGPIWYGQEYLLDFISDENQFFTTESINSAFDSDLEPIFI